MITYTQIQRYDNLPFEDYLKLPAYSHSFLKRERNGVAEDIETTDNMRLGSMVDSILTEPGKVSMSDHIYPYARDIAATIKSKFQGIITAFQKQVSYTAIAHYGDFEMRVKGRLDFLLPNIAVIDLKITKAKDLGALINFMGYKNQLCHYCKLAKVNTAYLMIYSVPLKKTEIIKIDCSSNNNSFWEEKICRFGTVKQLA